MPRALLALAILCGCSRDEARTQPEPDAFVEDTAEPIDTTAPDAVDARPSCVAPLDAAFACGPARERLGQRVCNDAALSAVLVCFGTDGKACSDATAKYPECSACVQDWLEGDRIDFASCVRAIEPTGTCASTVQCTLDCLDAVCSTCDPRVGSGGMPARSARDDCERAAAESGASCWDVAAKNYAACATDPRLQLCFPRTHEQLVVFFRGACRDGGDYSRAHEAEVTDAAAD